MTGIKTRIDGNYMYAKVDYGGRVLDFRADDNTWCYPEVNPRGREGLLGPRIDNDSQNNHEADSECAWREPDKRDHFYDWEYDLHLKRVKEIAKRQNE